MTQQSFDFGPSHNTRNPATDTSSSAGIDDLISKLGSMLSLTPKSNDNLAEILKKAVKEGIEEAQKSDARTDDSEERAAARHHKEIVSELKRIASLGGGKGHGGGSDTDEKKKDDGLSITDIMKWGAVAGGVGLLVANLGDLTKGIVDTKNKILDAKNGFLDFITSAEQMKGKLAEISADAFSENGAIGALAGAFAGTGIIGKAVYALLGSVGGESVLTKAGIGNMNNTDAAGNPIIPGNVRPGQPGYSLLPTDPNNPNAVAPYALPSTVPYDPNNTGLIAGTAMAIKGGGSPLARAAKFLTGYFLAEQVIPEHLNNGQEKPGIIPQIVEKNKDTIRNIGVTTDVIKRKAAEDATGAAIGGTAGFMTARRMGVSGKGAVIAGVAGAAIGAISGDDDILNTLYESASLDNMKRMTNGLLGKDINHQEGAYDKKIREYDEQIKELRKQRFDLNVEIRKGTKDKNKQQELLDRLNKIKSEQTNVEKEKDTFESTIDTRYKESLSQRLSTVPDYSDAGKMNYGVDKTTGQMMAAGAALGTTIGAPIGLGIASPATATLGAAAGASIVYAGSKAVDAFAAEIEQYISSKYKKNLNIMSLVFSDISMAYEVIGNYANEHPYRLTAFLSAIALTSITPGSSASMFIKVVKNVKSMMGSGLGKMLGRNALVAGEQLATFSGRELGKMGAGFAGAGVFGVNLMNKSDKKREDFADVLTTQGNFNINLQSTSNAPTGTPTGEGASLNTSGNPIDIGALSTNLPPSGANIPFRPYSELNPLAGNDANGFPTVLSTLVPTPASPTDNLRNDSSGSWGSVFGNIVNGVLGGSPTALPQNPVNAPQGNAPNIPTPSHTSLAGDNRTFAKGKFIDDGLTTIITTKKGTKVEVAKSRAANFEGFLNELEATGYDIKTITGLSNRHGSKNLPHSTHNMGIAIDINPNQNRQASREGGPRMTDMNPSLVRSLAKKYDLEWGGDYGRPDAMHFTVDKSKRTPEEDQYNIRNSIFAKRAMGLTGNTSQNPMGDLIGQILRTESHGNPNAFWGDKSGKYDDLLGGKQLSQLTFAELREFQKKLTERTRGFDPKHPDKGTSAAGIGQWVGSTLFGENYDNTGFLTDYFGGKNYDNEVFSLDRQKDMFKSFLKSKKYGNLEGFLGSNMSSEAYATQLGNQWQGVQNPEEKQRLIATLDKLKKSPHANIDKELDNLMAQMDSLVSTSDKFNNAMGDVGKAVKSALSSLGDFFKNIMEEAPKLLPDELKALVDMPGVLDFLEPLFGGESRSTLAHPTRTLEKGDILKVKSMILGKSVEELQAMESAKLNNVEITPLTNGNDLLYTSKRVADNKSRANNNYLGDIINMTAAQTHQGESVKGNIFNGAGGYTDTHHPGDRDAFAINIYSYGDGPAFYNSGGTGPFGF